MKIQQTCVHSGYWIIEGFDVVQLSDGNWRVLTGRKPTLGSLQEARQWISDEVNGRHT